VLGAVATTVGLVAAQLVLQRWGTRFLEENLGRLPFWYDLTLSPATVLYAAGLTFLAAAISGVLPALKVTRGFGSRLRQWTAGGGGVQFGGVWTAVIIAQVAFTVAFPAIGYVEQRELVRVRSFPAGFAAEEYLAVRLEMQSPSELASNADARAAQGARFMASLEALRQRVAAEPGVRGVTFVDRLPRDGHHEYRIELDEPSAASRENAATALRVVQTAMIEPAYFDVLESPILAGRRFNASELGPNLTRRDRGSRLRRSGAAGVATRSVGGCALPTSSEAERWPTTNVRGTRSSAS
jgi:hypothetical protein